MRQVPVKNVPLSERETMRQRHKLGDDQIVALWDWRCGMSISYDHMNFTPPALSRIAASTLAVYGDRDFLYSIETGVGMYRAIPKSALWVVPNGRYSPVFLDGAALFAQTALAFFRNAA
jgi:pimeloyl-ACP methyl ester carboxylesterase